MCSTKFENIKHLKLGVLWLLHIICSTVVQLKASWTLVNTSYKVQNKKNIAAFCFWCAFYGIMDLLKMSIWHCQYLCRRMKDTDLKRWIDVFDTTKCLHRIMGYHWYDFESNQQLFRETDSRPIHSLSTPTVAIWWASGMLPRSWSCL